jgi:twinkle protein
MLVAGRGKEVIDAIWGAKAFRPDGIVTSRELRAKLIAPIKSGLSWPWDTMTRATHGIRTGEIYTLGAGTGMGKSEVWKEVAAHLIVEHKQKVGGMFLEETPEHTLRCIAGKIDSTMYHLPDVAFNQDDMLRTCDSLSDALPLYDSFGYTEYEVIKARLRYLAVSLGCKYIVLDHITALVTGDKDADERRQLDYIMTDLASAVRELDIALFLISHLSTPEGKSHEEGGRVMLKHFRGSRAIGQWSNFVFGIERDQQDENEEMRHTSTFRILKDRYTGRATGQTFGLKYNQDTGRLIETDEFAGAVTATQPKQEF